MRFFYLRDRRGLPVSCIASQLLPDNQVKFAVATYNPRDAFDRDLMRGIAEERLKKGSRVFEPMQVEVVPPAEKGQSVKLRIVCTVIDNTDDYEVRDVHGQPVIDQATGKPLRKRVIPHHAKKAAMLWLRERERLLEEEDVTDDEREIAARAKVVRSWLRQRAVQRKAQRRAA
jgi:hypothetical protein